MKREAREHALGSHYENDRHYQEMQKKKIFLHKSSQQSCDVNTIYGTRETQTPFWVVEMKTQITAVPS